MKKSFLRLIALLIVFIFVTGSLAFADVASFDPSQYSDEELQQIQEIITNELYARAQAWAKEHGDRKISFESYEISIARGKTEKVVPTITRNIDTAPEKTKLIWASDDENIATVKDGNIQAKGIGNCLVTCRAEDNEFINSAIAVTVFEPVKSIKSDITQATVEIGSYIIPNISFDPENATFKNVEWSSSDETIAEVSSDFGRIVALEKGDCVITAKTIDGSEKKVSIKIHVPAFAVEKEEYVVTEPEGIKIPIILSGISSNDVKISTNKDVSKYFSWEVANNSIMIKPKRRGVGTITLAHGKDKKDINIKIDISSYSVNKNLKRGDIVKFGHYEQDGNKGNGQESIEWEITSIDENGIAELTSVYILDEQAWDKKGEENEWPNSALYQWLQGTFKKTAFSEDDYESIKELTLISPSVYYMDELALIGKNYGSDRDNIKQFASTKQAGYYWFVSGGTKPRLVGDKGYGYKYPSTEKKYGVVPVIYVDLNICVFD